MSQMLKPRLGGVKAPPLRKDWIKLVTMILFLLRAEFFNQVSVDVPRGEHCECRGSLCRAWVCVHARTVPLEEAVHWFHQVLKCLFGHTGIHLSLRPSSFRPSSHPLPEGH